MSRRTGIMLCYPYSEKRLRSWPKPWLVQAKLDGERCRAQIDESGNVRLLSSEANVIHSVPHINQAIQDLCLKDVELDGELYRHGWGFQKIHSVVGRTVNIHSDYEQIQYWVFDLVDYDMTQGTRLLRVPEVSNPLVRVTTTNCWSVKQVEAILQNNVHVGHEGVVIRHHDASYVDRKATTMMKWKPRKQDKYVVIGVEEEISKGGVPKGTLGAFVCRKDGKTFRVGTGPELTKAKRAEYWEDRSLMPGSILVVKYQELSTKGIPRFPVAFELEV